jgi:hypothetical protein
MIPPWEGLPPSSQTSPIANGGWGKPGQRLNKTREKSREMNFKYVKQPWVVALGTDVQTMVWRSEVVDKTGAEYAPVREHLEGNGMVLIEEELLPSDPHIYGRTWKSWFAVPSARNLLMAFPPDDEKREA